MAVVLFAGNEAIVIDEVEVDAKIGEYHSFSATPTQFAIESGAIASDHITEQPDSLEVAFVLSNLDDEEGSSYGNRAATQLDALVDRLKRRQLYEVVTRHRLYPSMAVVSIKVEHVSPFSGALRGRISFQEVNRDRLDRVRLPAARVKKPTAASKEDAGRVEPKEAKPADKKRASVLSQLFKRVVPAIPSVPAIPGL